jgi:hypothetical protein
MFANINIRAARSDAFTVYSVLRMRQQIVFCKMAYISQVNGSTHFDNDGIRTFIASKTPSVEQISDFCSSGSQCSLPAAALLTSNSCGWRLQHPLRMLVLLLLLALLSFAHALTSAASSLPLSWPFVLEVLSPNENTNFTLSPAFTPSIATLDAEVNLPVSSLNVLPMSKCHAMTSFAVGSSCTTVVARGEIIADECDSQFPVGFVRVHFFRFPID